MSDDDDLSWISEEFYYSHRYEMRNSRYRIRFISTVVLIVLGCVLVVFVTSKIG